MNTDEPTLNPELERQIQAAVEKRIANWHSQTAAAMQTSMQEGLAALDKVRDQLEAERAVLIEEQEQTREQREGINRRAHQLLQEAIQQNYKSWKQEIELGFLSRRVHSLITSGETEANICRCLDVTQEFVASIEQKIKNDEIQAVQAAARGRSKNRISLPDHPRLTYDSSGRSGNIHFKNDFTQFNLWWEFGGDALALVGIPTSDQWESQTGIPLSDRDATLRFIAEQVIDDQTRSGGTYQITEDFLTIYLI